MLVLCAENLVLALVYEAGVERSSSTRQRPIFVTPVAAIVHSFSTSYACYWPANLSIHRIACSESRLLPVCPQVVTDKLALLTTLPLSDCIFAHPQ